MHPAIPLALSLIPEMVCRTLCQFTRVTFSLKEISVFLAGRNFTEYLMRILTERNCFFTTFAVRGVVRDVREQLHTLPLDFNIDTKEAFESADRKNKYEFLDGNIFTVGSERFCCPEVLFQPSFVGKEASGIHNTTFQSTTKCDVDILKDLHSNVVLCGGTTMFAGIGERMNKELIALATMKIKVVAPAERKFSLWIGGLMGSFVITSQQLHHCGPQVRLFL